MIELVKKAAEKGGKVALDFFRKDVHFSDKLSYRDIVTEADVASQKTIQDFLLRSLVKKGYKENELGFIGEEGLRVAGKYQFVIDPIDGTSNFASGLDYFAVSVAMLENGKAVCGAVYDPVRRIFYIAEKGKGSFKIQGRKNNRLSIKRLELEDSLTCYHYSSRVPAEEQNKGLNGLYSKSRGVRLMGSLVLDLCYFADNVFGVVANRNCYIWDLAAAKLIIEEAGGVVTDWQGNEIIYNLEDFKGKIQVVACHPDNLSEVTSVLEIG
jgi:myo-inositol-1(or 4)-monophosphatase